MKTAFVLLMIAVTATAAYAQPGGRIELFADAAGSDCNILDTGGIVEVHIWHRDIVEVFTAQYRIPKPTCWLGATWISDVTNHLIIGDTQSPSGWAPHYIECISGDIYVGKILFATTGDSFSCCQISVTKAVDGHPEFDGPIGVDCAHELNDVGAGSAMINGDGSCPCMIPVPVEKSTWGRVKSLYQ